MPTAVSTLITDLCGRMGWNSASSTPRADALKALNVAEKWISQRYSLSYLQFKQDIVMAVADSTIAITTFTHKPDMGKTIIFSPGTFAEQIAYRPVDQFLEENLDTYGMIAVKKPAFWTWYLNASSAIEFKFKPANTTGGNLTIHAFYQRLVAALTDAANSYSLLPEGYEETILIDRAEVELKRQQTVVGWELLDKRNREDLERFYQGYRTTKEKAMMDPEQVDRKAAERLHEGA